MIVEALPCYSVWQRERRKCTTKHIRQLALPCACRSWRQASRALRIKLWIIYKLARLSLFQQSMKQLFAVSQ